jgi:hypothetical protein
VPRRSPCLALRASSVETLCHRTWGSKNIERRLPAPVAPSAFGDAANCPGVPLVWPCVLPQRRPCVTGLGVRKISRGGLQHPLRMASFGDIVVNCPGVSLVWSCVLPQWRPRATGLVEFEKDREGCKRCLQKLLIVDYYLLLLLSKFKVRTIQIQTPLFLPSFTRSIVISSLFCECTRSLAESRRERPQSASK